MIFQRFFPRVNWCVTNIATHKYNISLVENISEQVSYFSVSTGHVKAAPSEREMFGMFLHVEVSKIWRASTGEYSARNSDFLPLIRLKFHNFLDSQIQLIQNFNVQVESLLKLKKPNENLRKNQKL